jgi:hypothetical protein
VKQVLVVLLFCLSASISAQSAPESLSAHSIWRRDLPFANASVSSSATIDSEGGLWFISDLPKHIRLFHLNTSGDVLSQEEIPANLQPGQMEETSFAIASLQSGIIGILANHSHVYGRGSESDGADFAEFKEGKFGPPVKIAGSGPQYTDITALSDNHFLVMGDQEPLTLIDVDERGKVQWRRRYPSSWDLASGASLENGASCVLSGAYSRPLLHLIRLDGKGVQKFRIDLPGWGGQVAAGPNGSCAVLRQRGKLGGNTITYFLSSFDSSLKPLWSIPVQTDAPWGGTFHLATLQDGYLVVSEAGSKSYSLYMAKYDFSGKLLWSVKDDALQAPSQVPTFGDNFYLIFVGDQDPRGAIVIRGH